MQLSNVVTLASLVVIFTCVPDVSSDWWSRQRDRAVGAIVKAGDDIAREASNAGQSLKEAGHHIAERIQPESENVAEEIKSWFGNNDDNNEETTPSPEVVVRAPALKCPSLVNPSTEFSCHFLGVKVDCSREMAIGTVANMKCSKAYVVSHHHQYDTITCTSLLSWSKRPIHCVPDCGKLNLVGGQELLSNGKKVSVAEFPWHVGIYTNKSGSYDQFCGGTLITPSFIVSAAHCFWNEHESRVNDKNLYKVAAGKFDRDWYADEIYAQKRDIIELTVYERYEGSSGNLAYDISLLKVSTPIVLTINVNVACVDWDSKFEEEQLTRGNNGSIAGWGINENNTRSDFLHSLQLPFVPFLTCKSTVHVEFRKYLTHDKLCAGYVDKGTSICPGDSGGGYVFPRTSIYGTRYYLRGIASAGHRPVANTGSRCYTDQLAAFTQLSSYQRWLDVSVCLEGCS